MSLLVESADLDGVLSPPVDKDLPVSGFIGRAGCLGDRKGLRGGDMGALTGVSGVTFKVSGSDETSSESSSIGAPDDSDGEDETGSGDDEDEVQSTLSLDDLEQSLPSKKGLSTFYGGRSKSYGNLADVKSVGDMQKPDNPFNKRRRNLLAHKLSSWSTSSTSSPSKRRMMIKDSRSSFYGHLNPVSMPLLPLHEDEDEEDDDDDDDDDMDGDGGRKAGIERCDLRLELNGGSRFCI